MKGKIGTDYELFMQIEGNLVPVPDTVDIGSKHGKHVELDGGTMHRDNVMVELCPDATNDVDEFTSNIIALTQQAEGYMSTVMNDKVTLVAQPSVKFEGDVLASRAARELGCDRDYLASRGEVVGRLPLTANLLKEHRCGGGHIHMSYGVTHDKHPAIAIHLSDLTIGALEATFGSQGVRRGYYGMAGLFRPKTYGNIRGVEYRTPSNLWLKSEECINAMGTNALSTLQVLENESYDDIIALIGAVHPDMMAQEVLENENSEAATAVLVAVQNSFPNYDWKVGA